MVSEWLLTAEVHAGVLDIFEAGEVALGSEGSPTCIVCEAGQYSLAHYMARMERNPSAARQKSTLTQLLEAVSYLHGRSMVSPRSHMPQEYIACSAMFAESGCLQQAPSVMTRLTGWQLRANALIQAWCEPLLGGAGAPGDTARQLRVVRQREQVALGGQPDMGSQGH